LGFRKYSCKTAIQTVIDKWKMIISDEEMIGVISGLKTSA